MHDDKQIFLGVVLRDVRVGVLLVGHCAGVREIRVVGREITAECRFNVVGSAVGAEAEDVMLVEKAKMS